MAGIGWGYEIIRKPQVSLIIGGALGVSDFGITLPSGNPLPVLPLPLIHFNIDTQWFVSSFDFLSGPNFSFTVAPKEKMAKTAAFLAVIERAVGVKDGSFSEFAKAFK